MNENQSRERNVFCDDFVETIVNDPSNPKNAVVEYDYTPDRGRFYRFERLLKFQKISVLSLIGQNIQDLGFMEHLVYLKRADLAWNSITSMISLTKLANLEYLNLNHNLIDNIPKSISGLAKLNTLHIAFNPLTDIALLYNLKMLSNLTSLDIEGCQISCSDDSLDLCVYMLPQLNVLNRTVIHEDTRKRAKDRYDRERVEQLTELNNQLVSEYQSLKEASSKLQVQLNDHKLDGNSAAVVITELRRENEQFMKLCETQELKISNLKAKLENERQKNNELNERIENMDAQHLCMTERIKMNMTQRDIEMKCIDLEQQLELKNEENSRLINELESLKSVLAETKQGVKQEKSRYKESLSATNAQLNSANMEIAKLKNTIEREREQHDQEKSEMVSKIEVLGRKNHSLLEKNESLSETCHQLQAGQSTCTEVRIEHEIEYPKDTSTEVLKDQLEILKSQITSENEHHEMEVRKLSEKLKEQQIEAETNANIIQGYKAKFQMQASKIDEMKEQQKEMVGVISSLKRKLEQRKAVMTEIVNAEAPAAQQNAELEELLKSQTKQISTLKKAVKEQYNRVNSLRERNEHLEKENSEMKQKVETLVAHNKDDELQEKVRLQSAQIENMKLERERIIETIGREIKSRDLVIAKLRKGESVEAPVMRNELACINNDTNVKELESENTRMADKIAKLSHQLKEKERMIKSLKTSTVQLEESRRQLIHEIEQRDHHIMEISVSRENDAASVASDRQEIAALRDGIAQRDSALVEQKRVSKQRESEMRENMMNLQIKAEELAERVEQEAHFIDVMKNEIMAQRKTLGITSSVPDSEMKAESCHLICAQTFKEVNNMLSSLKEELAIAQNKCRREIREHSSQMSDLVEDNKLKEDMIIALNAKLHTAKTEIDSARKQIKESISKEEYTALQSKYESTLAENNRNTVMIKNMAAQIGRFKTSGREMAESNSEQVTSLRQEIEQLKEKKESNSKKRSELQAKNEKLEWKVSELEHALATVERENKQLTEKCNKFSEFEKDITSAIERSEQRYAESEEKIKGRLKECENEKRDLQSFIQEQTDKISELKNENLQLSEQFCEMEVKMKQKQRDVMDLDKMVEMLREQLKLREAEFHAEKAKDKDYNESLIRQLEELRSQTDSMNLTMNCEKEDLSRSLRLSEQKERKLQKKLGKIAAYAEELQKSLDVVTKQNAENAKLVQQSNAKIREHDEKAKRMEEMMHTTDHLFNALTAKYNRLVEDHNALKVLAAGNDAEKTSLLSKIEQQNEDIDDLKREIEELSSLADKHGENMREKDAIIENLKEKLERVEAVNQQRDDKLLETAKENHDLRQQLADMTLRIEDLGTEMQELRNSTVPTTSFEMQRTKCEELQANITSMAKELESYKEALCEEQKKHDGTRANAEEAWKRLNSVISDLNNRLDEANQENDKIHNTMNETTAKYEEEVAAQAKQIEDLKLKVIQQEGEKLLVEKKAADDLDVANGELKRKQSELNDKEDECAAHKRMIDDLNNRIKKQDGIIQEQSNKLKDAIDDYKSAKNQHEQESDDRIRQISALRKQVRDLEDEKRSMERAMDDVQSQLRETQVESSQKITKAEHDELSQKYDSLKKLAKFESTKAQMALAQKQAQLDETLDDLKAKQQEFKDRVDELNSELSDKKDLIKKLQKQMQLDNERLQALEDADKRCKIVAHELENMQAKTTRLQSEAAKGEKLQNTVNQVASVIETLASTFSQPQSKTKTEIMNDIVARINDVSKLLSLGKVPSVRFADYRRVASTVTASIAPESETFLSKHKKILDTIKQALLSFPIGNPKFDIESQDQLEGQLEQLGSLIHLIKRLFDDREKHVEELVAMVETQHKAVMRMSEAPIDTSTLSESYLSFNRSQSILENDRFNRQRMMSSQIRK